MIARALTLALAVAGVGGTAWAADASPLASAQRATRELRYEDAGREVAEALRHGHHARKELVALYALRAEVASIVDGGSAGESEFRRLLVLAPDHAPPRNTPIFSAPFARAQRWVAAHGHLEVEHKLGAAPRLGAPTPLVVVVTNDPLAMVADARLWVRMPGETDFVAQPAASLRPSVPAIPPGGAADYYLEMLDADDSVVAELGTAAEPFTLEAPTARPAPPPRVVARPALEPTAPAIVAARPLPARHRARTGGGVLAAFGLGALGAAIGVDVAGRAAARHAASELRALVQPARKSTLSSAARAPPSGSTPPPASCSTTSVILFTVDLTRSRRR